MSKLERLTGRTVIVTGGAQGIGRAMALGLVSEGAKVAIVDIAEDAARSLVESIGAEHGAGRALAIRADICQPDECARVVAQAVERFGQVDGLVNNAGRGMTAIRSDYLDRPVPFWEVDADRWQALMDLNVRAPFFLAKLIAPRLVAQKWGRIINITTSLDTMYRAAYTPYGPSKAWLEAATVGWARDLEGTGVTCNALIPGGAVNTAFFDKSAPLQRDSLIQPEAMVAPACWILSDEAGGISGHRFVARLWDRNLADADAAKAAGSPAAWQMLGSQSLWPGAKPVQ
ncbi:SDR family NAD(P)-dependent oxidoreductase [Bordetella sp. BOR01]|uniref:SDR family NAD(P)-dependent oxidoreductase n=1 Tax=Bordetella sp. BOR01 TaxID=2854779 RepID=UPI001C43C680|nr:SDR family oxidoreductase [Bordetella sp. BOR01]MBV7482758.1 SDR family oxidoreductase [Bordetella sp. BOR01]